MPSFCTMCVCMLFIGQPWVLCLYCCTFTRATHTHTHAFAHNESDHSIGSKRQSHGISLNLISTTKFNPIQFNLKSGIQEQARNGVTKNDERDDLNNENRKLVLLKIHSSTCSTCVYVCVCKCWTTQDTKYIINFVSKAGWINFQAFLDFVYTHTHTHNLHSTFVSIPRTHFAQSMRFRFCEAYNSMIKCFGIWFLMSCYVYVKGQMTIDTHRTFLSERMTHTHKSVLKLLQFVASIVK